MGSLRLPAKLLKEAALARLAPRIVHLVLHVTRRCNMRCRHCFIDFSDAPAEWMIDDIRPVADRLRRLLWLDIGGGEPLLRDDLEDILSLFAFEELSIPTNGWEVERIVSRLGDIHRRTGGKLIVTLSLEGLPATHDAIRRQGSFERTVATCRRLREIPGLRVKFNTVLCNRNAGEIVDLMHFVQGLHHDFHSILMLRGTPKDPLLQLPPLETIAAMEDEVWRVQQSYTYGRAGIMRRVQANYQAYKRAVGVKTLDQKRQVVPCRAGRSHLVIWANGDVAPCELLPAVGNLRKQRFPEVLRGAAFRDTVAGIRKGRCHCTHDCNMIENILFDPRSYWELLKR